MALALYHEGILSLNAEKFAEAERDLHNCIERLAGNDPLEHQTETFRSLRLEAMSGLTSAFFGQHDLDGVQNVLKERITMTASFHTEKDSIMVSDDTLLLTHVLLEKGDFAEALLYGRRAYRMLKKQVPQNRDKCKDALKLLSRACQANGNQSDADGYLALLRQKFQTKSPAQERARNEGIDNTFRSPVEKTQPQNNLSAAAAIGFEEIARVMAPLKKPPPA